MSERVDSKAPVPDGSVAREGSEDRVMRDETYGGQVARRLDACVGLVEWLKTDLLKKGAGKRYESAVSLSEILERTAILAGAKESTDALSMKDQAILELMTAAEKRLEKLTQNGAIINEEDIRQTASAFTDLERALKEKVKSSSS
jgi:hypothetical protein